MQQHNLCELCLKFVAELYVCYATGAFYSSRSVHKRHSRRGFAIAREGASIWSWMSGMTTVDHPINVQRVISSWTMILTGITTVGHQTAIKGAVAFLGTTMTRERVFEKNIPPPPV